MIWAFFPSSSELISASFQWPELARHSTRSSTISRPHLRGRWRVLHVLQVRDFTCGSNTNIPTTGCVIEFGTPRTRNHSKRYQSHSYTSILWWVNIRICQANDADVQKFDSDVTHNHENFFNQRLPYCTYLLEVTFKMLLSWNVR